MFLRPSLGVCLQPTLFSSIKNTRSLRSSIKVGKGTYQLSVDVHRSNKDEIRVKVHPEYVVTIEAKQEKDTHQGYNSRQIIRKFKLPEGCDPSKVKCTLCPEGLLKVEAQRTLKYLTTPVEAVLVPISYGRSQRENIDESIGAPPTKLEVLVNRKNYPTVIPKD